MVKCMGSVMGMRLWFDTPRIDGEHVEGLKRAENGPTGEMRLREELRRQAWVRGRTWGCNVNKVLK